MRMRTVAPFGQRACDTALLQLDRTAHRVAGAAEREEEGVALRVDLLAAVLARRCSRSKP